MLGEQRKEKKGGLRPSPTMTKSKHLMEQRMRKMAVSERRFNRLCGAVCDAYVIQPAGHFVHVVRGGFAPGTGKLWHSRAKLAWKSAHRPHPPNANLPV
jgi:hypothetical protein